MGRSYEEIAREYYSGGGSSKPAKKGKKSHSIEGFVGNTLGGIGDMLAGALLLPIYGARAGYSDINKAVHGNLDSYKDSSFLDLGEGIIKGMGKQYKDYYSPLVHGNFGKFADNIYDNPTQIALDALTAVTLGGAGAGKAGQAAAAAGKVSNGAAIGSAARAGERVAGLKRMSRADFDALPLAVRRQGVRGKGDTMLVPQGFDLVSPTTGVKYTTLDTARNPVKRSRQKYKEAAFKKFGGDDAAVGRLTKGYFHPDTRGVRLVKAQNERVERRAVAEGAKELARLHSKATPVQRFAAYHIATTGIKDAGEYAKALQQRIGKLAEAGDARTAAYLKRDLSMFEKARNEILEPSDLTRQMADKGIELSDRVQVARKARGASVDESPATILAEQESLKVHEAKLESLEAKLKEAEGKPRTKKKVERLKREIVQKQADIELIGSRARAAADTRASLQRRVFGLDVDPSQKLAIVSHSLDHMPRAMRRSLGKTNKKTGELLTPEDLFASGAAFEKAMYTPDLMRMAKSYTREISHVGKVRDFKYMMQLATRYDSSDPQQQAMLQSGKLKALKPDDPAVQHVGELSNFIAEKLGPISDDAADLADLLDEWVDEIEGSPLVMPRAAYDEITRQVVDSSTVLKRVLAAPTRVWRDMTLSLKGSFYANNFLGNLLLGFIAYGPAYLKELVTSGSKRSKYGKIVDEITPDMQHGGVLGVTRELSDAEIPALPAGRLAKAIEPVRHPFDTISRVANFFAEQGAKGTENNFRRAATSIELKRMMKDLQRVDGIDEKKALQAIVNDADAIDALAEKAYGNMLDYSKLTPFERDSIRPLYPFWAFIRAMTGRTVRLALDEPWKLEVIANLSRQGVDKNEHGIFASVKGRPPAWLEGLAPIGDTKDGKTPVYSTYAANPFSAVSDMAGQLGSLVSKEAAGEQSSPFAAMNPYVRSAIEASVGKDLFMKMDLTGSRGGIFKHQLAMNFPQYAAYDRARHPNPDAVVSRTLGQSGLQFLGVPMGTYDEDAMARQMALNDYYNRIDDRRAMRREAKRASRDIGWDLGLRDNG